MSVCVCYRFNNDKRSTASWQSSKEPNAVSLTYPSPAEPNPTPGVHAILQRFRSMSKMSMSQFHQESWPKYTGRLSLRILLVRLYSGRHVGLLHCEGNSLLFHVLAFCLLRNISLSAARCDRYDAPLNFVDCLRFHNSLRLIKLPLTLSPFSSLGTTV